MRKLSLFLFTFLIYQIAFAQYNQGDINLNLIPFTNHDSTMCSTTGDLSYAITVQNSSSSDTVYVRDMVGNQIDMRINTSGASPWNLNISLPMFGGIVSDDQLSGGWAYFGGPNTKVICGQDTIKNIVNSFSHQVTDPCIYGTVNGRIFIDNNSNCTYGSGDSALKAVPTVAKAALSSPSTNSITHFGQSANNGNYSITVQESWMTNYTVSIPPKYQFIFPSTSCSPPLYTFNSLPQSNVDFSLQCTSNKDVLCYAGSPGWARPSMPFMMSPTVSNTGCDTTSGKLVMVLDSRVTYNASLSNNPAQSVNGDTLTWNFSKLTSISNGAYWNSMVSSIHLSPNSSVNAGDTLCFNLMATTPSGDVDPNNNSYSVCIPVVNSYDPNYKAVVPKGTGASGDIPQSTDELTYTIHFQNTGTAPALNISIVDTLDTTVIDPRSLRILATSHRCNPRWVKKNVVQFDYKNINLPDSTSNEAASHGSVTFKVDLKAPLPLGTEIRNRAYIYFDNNPAIITDDALNTIVAGTGFADNAMNEDKVKAFPNPFSDKVTIQLPNNPDGEEIRFRLFDIMGNTVKEKTIISQKQFTIDRNGLSNGAYFFKITGKHVSANGKLLIQ